MKTLICFMASLVFLALQAMAEPLQWQAEGWTKTDFSKRNITWSEIQSGGPPKDGIPSIDAPSFVLISDVNDIGASEPVIGLELNGEAKAYPLRVLMWHEIANDVVAGQPVAVTYCPLCNAAIVFDRRVDGVVLDFGTTGKLRNSDLVMYDRQTESWWQQFTGYAIIGHMTGKSLAIIPSRLESFADFKRRHPGGKVLVPSDPSFRDYGRNPYEGYDQLDKPFLYNGEMPDGIAPMARVVLVRRENQQPLVISLEKLRTAGRLVEGNYEFTWNAGQSSALDTAAIGKGRDVGSIIVKSNGKDIAYDVTFAFVAHAFHPEAPIILK